MAQVVIENPILNSPYKEPSRHFKFSDEGITNEIVESRRISSYFVPIAKPKTKGSGKQLTFNTDWTQDRVKESEEINRIRARVSRWRQGDTDYNGESFFVRHAYFTDGEDKFERLKRTLRAEIDESAWETLYATTSRPFDPPKTGKIAVKVINHYGDEVLKVYEVK